MTNVYDFNDNRIGVYKITILNQPKDNVIPHRNDDGTLNWEYRGQFKCWSDNISLKLLRRYGGSFQVHQGYVYNMNTGYIFKKYLTPIMEQKMKHDRYKRNNNVLYNSALRECLKLLMNSLSGKMGQLPISKDSVLCNSTISCDRFINKYKKDASVIRIKEGL